MFRQGIGRAHTPSTSISATIANRNVNSANVIRLAFECTYLKGKTLHFVFTSPISKTVLECDLPDCVRLQTDHSSLWYENIREPGCWMQICTGRQRYREYCHLIWRFFAPQPLLVCSTYDRRMCKMPDNGRCNPLN